MPTLIRTIARNGQSESDVLKSRFICTIERVTDETEARDVLERLRKQYWDANHNCYAWVIGEQGMSQKASDDGEPSGTAGVPMLEVLKRRELTDLVAVVTRYFGGTKLGAGGLIRAYGHAVSAAIDRIGIVERRPLAVLAVTADYADAGRLEHSFRDSVFPLKEIEYGADVTLVTHLEQSDVPLFETWLGEQTNGALAAMHLGETIVEVPVTTSPNDETES